MIDYVQSFKKILAKSKRKNLLMALFLGGVGFNLQKSEIRKNRKIARLLYLVLVSSARNIERRSQICAYKVYSQILAKPRDDQHLF
jgi:hypothetical protein